MPAEPSGALPSRRRRRRRASELTLRDGSAPPEGRVASCSIEGVVVASPVTGELIVGWERVRTVSGEHGAEAGAFGEVSDQAWRAGRGWSAATSRRPSPCSRGCS